MSDVKDILGLNKSPQAAERPSPFASASKKRKEPPASILPSDQAERPKKKQRRGKSGALTKEIERLAQDSLGLTIAAARTNETPKREFKEKPKLHRVRADHWILQPLQIPERTDAAVFKHWVKLKDLPLEIPTIRGSPIDILNYDDQTYNFFFNNDSEWTKEQTDYLMSMCAEFDLRFVVIHDRWDNTKYGNVSIEDIKGRYYFIQKTLLEQKAVRDESVKKNPILKNPYKKENEILRKKQLEKVFSRGRVTEKEEEELAPRWHNLIQTFESHHVDRAKVIKEVEKVLQRSDTVTKKKSASKPKPSKDQNKTRKYDDAVNTSLRELGVEKPKPTNLDAMAKYNTLKGNLALLFELQRIQAEALYELQVEKGRQALLSGQPVKKLNFDPFLPRPENNTH